MKEKLTSLIKRFHADDSGAMSVEKILILALVALPILILLLAFRKTIVEWFDTQRKDLTDQQTAP
jgi:Flp pilus assembly pilin Flp